MTLSLPIPGKKKKYSFYFICYNIVEGYTNHGGFVNLRETETIGDFRKEFEKKYGKNEGSFIVSVVSDNAMKKILDQNSKVEELTNSDGVILLYEIPETLSPKLLPREASDKFDSNYCISEDWTKSVTYMVMLQKAQYSYHTSIKPFNIPRIMWMNKNWTLLEVHHQVFKFFRHAFSELYSINK
jgi:hypothetical protein